MTTKLDISLNSGVFICELRIIIDDYCNDTIDNNRETTGTRADESVPVADLVIMEIPY